MKTLIAIALTLASFSTVGSFVYAADNGNMENDLKSLDVQEATPASTSSEKLYSVSSRAWPLKNHLEILATAAQNFTGDGFLTTQQVGGELQYHLTDYWSLAAGYSKVYNTFKDSATNLVNNNGLLPDVDFATSRIEGRAQYNLFYGKFRFSQDTVMYFDQYLGLGYASNQLGSGTAGGPVGDAGFAFWVSNWGSIHLGVKDYYYKETAQLSSGSHHNINGYLEVGYLL